MRKFILIVIAAALIGGGAYYYLAKNRLKVEDVIPRSPLFYLHVTDVKNNWNVIRKSNLWQAVAKIKYDVLLGDENMPAENKAVVAFLKNSVNASLDNPVFENLFSKEIAVAVYPTSLAFMSSADLASVSMPAVIQRLMANVFFVTRVSAKAQLADLLTGVLKIDNNNYEVSSFDYKKHTIYTVKSKESQITFSAVMIKDLLIAGIGTAATQRTVDISYESELPLSQDEDYSSASSKAEGKGLFVYGNVGEILKVSRDYLKNILVMLSRSNSEETSKLVNDVIGRMQGITNIDFAVDIQKPQVVFDVFFNKEQINPEFSSFYLKCTPQKNSTLSFIPQDIAALQWQTCLDFPEIWKMVIQEAEKQSSQKIGGQMRSIAGIDIEKELLPVLGDEAGGYLKDIQTEGFFPIPRVLLFVKVKSPQKMDEILKRVADETLFGVEKEDYNGYPISYMKTPLGDMLKPAYAYLGNYWTISLSSELIKRSIDVAKGGAGSFAADPSYRGFNGELDQPATFVQVVKLSVLLKQIEGVIEFANTWITSQDRENETARAAAAQKIDDIRAKIAQDLETMRSLEKDQQSLEDEVWNKESQAMNADEKKGKLQQIKDQAAKLKADIDSAQAEEKNLVLTREKLPQKAPEMAARRLFLDEAVYPVLNGLNNVKAMGVHSTLQDKVFRTTIYFNVN